MNSKIPSVIIILKLKVVTNVQLSFHLIQTYRYNIMFKIENIGHIKHVSFFSNEIKWKIKFGKLKRKFSLINQLIKLIII